MPDYNKQAKELFEYAKKRRQPHEAEMKEAYEYVMPTREFRMDVTENEYTIPDHRSIFDVTAILSSDTLVTNTMKFLIPESSPWAKLVFRDGIKVAVSSAMERRLAEANTNLFRHFSDSNFFGSTTQSLQDAVVSGTACVMMLDEPGKPLAYKAIPIDEIYFTENYDETIDAVFRKHVLIGRQLLKQPFNSMPEELTKECGEKQTEPFIIIECIIPEGSSFRHVVYQKEKFEQPLHEGTMPMNPFIIYRWKKIIGHAWGSSPVRKMLPAIRVVQAIVRDTLKYGAFAANGFWWSSDENLNLQQLKSAIQPGAVVPVGEIPEPAQFPGTFNLNFDMATAEREQIKGGLLDTTPPPSEQLQYMKSAAVQVLKEHWANTVGEPARLLQREFLQFVGDQAAMRLLRRGDLVQPTEGELRSLGVSTPMQLADLLRVDVSAALTKLLQMQEASDSMNAISRVGQLVGPQQIAVHVNMDELTPELLRNSGVPERFIRKPKEVAAIKKQIEAAAQAQAMAGAGAEGAAGAAPPVDLQSLMAAQAQAGQQPTQF